MSNTSGVVVFSIECLGMSVYHKQTTSRHKIQQAIDRRSIELPWPNHSSRRPHNRRNLQVPRSHSLQCHQNFHHPHTRPAQYLYLAAYRTELFAVQLDRQPADSLRVRATIWPGTCHNIRKRQFTLAPMRNSTQNEKVSDLAYFASTPAHQPFLVSPIPKQCATWGKEMSLPSTGLRTLIIWLTSTQ